MTDRAAVSRTALGAAQQYLAGSLAGDAPSEQELRDALAGVPEVA
jgi:hypothetical protein